MKMINRTALGLIALGALGAATPGAAQVWEGRTGLEEAAALCEQTAHELKRSKDPIAFRSWKIGHKFLCAAQRLAKAGHHRAARWAARRAVGHLRYPRRAAEKWLKLALPLHDQALQAGLEGPQITAFCQLVDGARSELARHAYGYSKVKSVAAIQLLLAHLQSLSHGHPQARAILHGFVGARMQVVKARLERCACSGEQHPVDPLMLARRTVVKTTLSEACRLYDSPGNDLAAWMLLCKAHQLQGWYVRVLKLHRHRKRLERRVTLALARPCCPKPHRKPKPRPAGECSEGEGSQSQGDSSQDDASSPDSGDDESKGGPKGNNGVGNGTDPQPPGNPPVNDGEGTGPGNPGNRGGANR